MASWFATVMAFLAGAGGARFVGRRRMTRSAEEDLRKLQEITREYVIQREMAEDELHRREQALRESETKYRMVAESMDDIVALSTPDGIPIYVSPSVERVLGFRVEDMEGHPQLARELPHPDDVAIVTGALNEVMNGSGTAAFEWRCRRADGTYRWLETRIRMKVTESGTRHMMTVARDIDKQRRTEDALRRLEERAVSLIERAAYGIYVSTPDGRFVDANPALVRMLGYESRDELLGVDIAQAVYQRPEDRVDLVQRHIAGGPTKDWVLVRWKKKDGTPITVQLTVREVRDESGDVVLFEGIADDITERERREELIRRSERMASLGTMVAGVAHELNNPLAAISGFTQLMMREPRSDEDRTALETIQHEATRTAKIVKDLLTLARQQSAIRNERLELNEVVSVIATSRRYALETRGIRLLVDLGASIPAVSGDRTQIEQVLLNLLINAQQALTTEGALELRRGAPAEIHIVTRAEDSGAVLEVSDNGPGIPTEYQERIWDPFWTTKPEGEGTGLGLAVVHSIVSAHGGSIELLSRIGEGSRFIVRFRPSSSASVQPAAAAPIPTPPMRAPLDVLVVDDEPSIIQLLRRYLGSRGHAVVTAADGAEALRLAARASFDVVVCDLRMPGMDGAELIERLRELPQSGGTRWIVSTGDNASASAVEKIARVRPDAVIVKPYNVEELRRVIEDELPAKPAPGSAQRPPQTNRPRPAVDLDPSAAVADRSAKPVPPDRLDGEGKVGVDPAASGRDVDLRSKILGKPDRH